MHKLINKVGPWVQGDEFWGRETEVCRFLELLGEGHHLLLTAPRRVGKTSLLKESLRRLATRDQDYGLFVDLQGCGNPEEAIVHLAMATRYVRSLWSKTKETFSHYLGEKVDSLAVDVIELKFREGTAEAWSERGDRLLADLAAADRPIVICLDELPVMVNRMLRNPEGEISPEGRRTADRFLSWLRRVCGVHQDKIRFVVCGSIGLEPVVQAAGLSHAIAHLRSFILPPWDRSTADGCLSALAANYGVELTDEVRSRMLDLIRWYVPHHVQMFFGHLLDDCRRRDVRAPTVEEAQRIYDRALLGARGHAELADYEERLIRVLDPELKPLAIELLTETAVTGSLTSEARTILARALLPKESDFAGRVRVVMDILEHDGYLARDPSEETHEFVSGLIRDWWRKRFGDSYVPARGRDS